ncbi:MAG TPA: YeeE/YedE family protein [Planctomycetota bacterium]|nr:YeeE/YedE family protein [Planctomycetota bacterium]
MRFWAAFAIVIAAVLVGLRLHAFPGRGRELSFTLLAGFAAGFVFQRSRFCFASAFRDLFQKRERRVLLGLLAALAVGSAGYMLIFGAWVPDPTLYRPDTAHIAPVGAHLVLGGALFGFGMVLGGGCITGHLYRAGEGSTVAWVGLLGIFVGYAIALAAWNPIYLNLVGSGRGLWLPERLGYAGAFALQMAALAAGAVILLKRTPAPAPPPAEPATAWTVARKIFVDGWPTWAGGISLGLIATFAYLRTSPLGVTEELGRLARLAGNAAGIVPERLHGLDGLKGCAAVANPATVSTNAVFVLALVGGALFAALIAGEFRPRAGTPGGYFRALGGGLLVGFGAMISLGCTVGTLMSGVMAFSLSGWVFFAALAVGAWAGTRALGRPTP